MPRPSEPHVCAACDGEGLRPGTSHEGEPCGCDLGDCYGPLDANGDCTRCGWSYDPPDPDYDVVSAQEQYEAAAEFKRNVTHRRR